MTNNAGQCSHHVGLYRQMSFRRNITTLSLPEAVKDVALPSAFHFQQKAGDWLTLLRNRASAENLLPCSYNGLDLDILDALRAQLIQYNGRILSSISLARAIAGNYKAVEIQIPHTLNYRDFADALAFLGRDASSIRPALPQQLGRSLVSNARLQLYRIKRWIQLRLPDRLRPEATTNSGTVLAVPRVPGHLADLLPVAKYLSEHFDIRVRFGVVDGRMADCVRSAGFTAFGLYSSSSSTAAWPHKIIRRFVRQHLELIESAAREQTLFDRIEAAALTARSKEVLQQHFFMAIRTGVALNHSLEVIRPSLVLVGNPNTFEGRMASAIAKSCHIPSATIEHGSIYPGDPMWEACPCEMICTWGEPSREALSACGISSDRIVVTGGPRHDNILASEITAKNGTSGSPIILVATSGAGDKVTVEQHQAFIQLLYQAVDMTPELRWVVKLHGKDRLQYYPAVPKATADRLSLVSSDDRNIGNDIFARLRFARALVTVSSTTALDAMVCDVPVITVDVWKNGKGLSNVAFLKEGCTYQASTAEELADAARRLWNRDVNCEVEQRARQLADRHFANRGCATRAVSEELLKLMKRPVAPPSNVLRV